MKNLIICTLAALFIFAAVPVHAASVVQPLGFGDHNDYDSSSGGVSSDFGFDFSFGSGSSSSSGSKNFSPKEIMVGLVFLVAIYPLLKKYNKGKTDIKKAISNAIKTAVKAPERNKAISDVILKKDPMFSADQFVIWAKEVYMKIQTAWMERDLEPVRPFLHSNLFSQTEQQIRNSYTNQNRKNILDRIAINTGYLTAYTRNEQFEFVTLYLNAKMIDYVIDENTDKVIRGDKTTRWDMHYKMKFMRSIGAQTKAEDAEAMSSNCPNCGAPLQITSAGKCEYCQAVVTTGDFSWVLCEFNVIRDNDVDEGIKE